MNRMKRIAWFGIGTLVVLAAVGGLGYRQLAGSERSCASCHEIQPTHDIWAESHHRDVPCADCHGTAVSNGIHSLEQSFRRLASHLQDEHPTSIRLSEDQVVEMNERCRQCHEREFGDWLASGHSVTYSAIFTNEKHNRIEQPMDDCLRCHGMFFEGNIGELVAPLNNQGPWKIVKAGHSSRPAIPCLTCHSIHFKGNPAVRPDYADPKSIAARRASRVPHAAFFDRNEKTHFDASILPTVSVRLGDRTIAAAQDPRQRVCAQCHAPGAQREAGSSDDRTPRGVHEGLSCMTCHENHSLETRQSCKECHPRLSNCGIDVEKMDTTFKSAQSTHNVHFVACADCHIKGVPARKPRT
jgi:hypothetical protein